ncbi:MAG: DUF485 domain-containing protein [Bryobacterales bacterium]|nr:DUF485 domain-containing protein [Bryobacterales bacterium]
MLCLNRMSHWDKIYAAAPYRRMIAQKTRAVCAMTVFFIAYYFALPVLVGYWPELMARPAWGKANWAYLFAFSQFLMAWAIAFLYMRFASRFDKMADEILADAARPGPQGGGG